MAKLPEKSSGKPTSQPDGDELEDLAQEISKRINNLVPSGQKSQIVAQMVSLVAEERFSGPIAHPRHLREYEDICPGAADRIISMAETSLSHSRTMHEKALDGDIADMKSGRLYGFLALGLILLSALGCGLTDHEALAGAFLGVGLLGVIGRFIDGKITKGET